MRISRVLGMAGLAAGMFGAPAAMASDPLTCPSGLICASKPQSVVDAITALDPKAKVSKDKDGITKLELSANYKYTIYLRDCEQGTKCAALTFSAYFSADPAVDMPFINDFNGDSRPGYLWLANDKSYYLTFEVSTYGGISAANLKDVKGWWESQLQQLGTFYTKRTTANAQATKK